MRHAIAILSIALAACGGGAPTLGSPEAPTSQQQQAVTQLNTSTKTVTEIQAGGQTGQSKVMELFAMMAGIGPTATKMRTSTGGFPFALGPEPTLFDPSFMPTTCVTPSGTSWTYNQCKSDDGKTTINGSVTVNGSSVALDLTFATSAQANVDIKLKGTLTVTPSSINGTLTYSVGASVGGLPGTGVAITTTVDYRMITFTANCITSGSIYVQYTGAGVDQAAEILFTDCNMVQVKNAK
jgi:hypothetical protein